MYYRWGHKYMGALQHAHRSFTGIKKSKRETESFRRLVKDMLEECRLKRMIFDRDDLGVPVELEDDVPVDQVKD
jgi:ribosomal protein L13